MTEGPGASDLSQSIGPEAELPSPSAAAAFGAVPRGLLGRFDPQPTGGVGGGQMMEVRYAQSLPPQRGRPASSGTRARNVDWRGGLRSSRGAGGIA